MPNPEKQNIFQNPSVAERKKKWEGVEYSAAYNQWRTEFTRIMTRITDPNRMLALKIIIPDKEPKDFTVDDADTLFNEFCRGNNDIATRNNITTFITRVITNLALDGNIDPEKLEQLLPHLKWIASGFFGSDTAKIVPPLIELQSAIHNNPGQVLEIFNSNKERVSKPTKDKETQKRTADEQALYDSLRHKVLLKEETTTTFSQIGGQANAVREAVILASQLKHPDQFKKWGILQPPKGIIFYGKPGNGKTLLAKAIATEVDAVFLHANAEDLLSNWQGLSAKLTKILFEICRDEAKKQDKHAILYIDEIDALIPSRKGRISEAALLSTSVILRELDGLLELGPITLITSTNNLDALDSAFLSRMTKQIEIPDPDAEGIESIFKIHLDKANRIAGRTLTAPAFEIHGENFVGLSGRDIENIIKVVLTTKAQQELEGKETLLITEEDIIEVMTISGKLIPGETKNH